MFKSTDFHRQVHITCSICNKLVDRIEWWQDAYRATLGVKVWCHGDTDQCEIPWNVLHDLDRALTEGVAFTAKRIP